MQLPIFPSDTKLINPTLGIREVDGMVYYLHNGNPISCHNKSDLLSYRYTCGLLVSNGLCTGSQLAKAIGVNTRNIQRYAQKYKEEGGKGFFQPQTRKGQAHKLTPEKLEEAATLLRQGESRYKVAREIGVSEGAIRYQINQGKLPTPKKKL